MKERVATNNDGSNADRQWNRVIQSIKKDIDDAAHTMNEASPWHRASFVQTAISH